MCIGLEPRTARFEVPIGDAIQILGEELWRHPITRVGCLARSRSPLGMLSPTGMMFKSSARNSNALMTQKRSPISKGKIFNDIELENIREITKL